MENIERSIYPKTIMSRKVLIIAFCFPPMQVIGSQRPYGLAKYLPRFGWEPIVLTIDHKGSFPSGIEVLATAYRSRLDLIKKAARFKTSSGIHQQMGITVNKNFRYTSIKSMAIKIIREIAAYPDEEIGWLAKAYSAASQLMAKEKINAVISTSFPVTAHLVAKRIKKKYGIPWIADLRDLWTQNHYYGKSFPVRALERQLEIKTLSYADALVTISEPLVEELKRLHTRKKVMCVTNGFDPDDFQPVYQEPETKFSLTHTGRLYNGKRDPSVLFKAVKELIDNKKIGKSQIELNFYGPTEDWLAEDIRKYGMNGIAHVRGNVSRETAIKIQQQSQLLILLLWNNEKEKGVFTGKLFEYLGSRRPVIAIGDDNSIVKDLLYKTGAGHFAKDQKQLEQIIMNYYRDFLKEGTVGFKGNQLLENYSYNSIALQYSNILNDIISPENRSASNEHI